MRIGTTTYDIYTDGAAKGNGYTHCSGGWAFVILENRSLIHKLDGSALDTTNQKMELTAVAEALKICKLLERPGAEFHIYSDSAYIINCCHQNWWKKWTYKDSWTNSKGEPVKNVELWKEIIPFFNHPSYFFHKVKGHADDEYNNMVDKMASNAAERYKES